MIEPVDPLKRCVLLLPRLARAVHAEVLVRDPLNLRAQLEIASNTGRQSRRVRFARLLFKIRRRGDRQLRTDRLEQFNVQLRAEREPPSHQQGSIRRR